MDGVCSGSSPRDVGGQLSTLYSLPSTLYSLLSTLYSTGVRACACVDVRACMCSSRCSWECLPAMVDVPDRVRVVRPATLVERGGHGLQPQCLDRGAEGAQLHEAPLQRVLLVVVLQVVPAHGPGWGCGWWLERGAGAVTCSGAAGSTGRRAGATTAAAAAPRRPCCARTARRRWVRS